jgi:hypothetical protein
MRRGDSEADAVVIEGFEIGSYQFDGFVGGEALLDDGGDVVAVFEAYDSIDLADLAEQLRAESLWEAAGDDDFLHLSFLFLFDGAAYYGEGFGFGGFYETTGIYNDDVGVISIVRNDEARLRNQGQHPFAIDEIFGTAEGDETDPSRPTSLDSASSRGRTSERAEAGSCLNFIFFCGHWPI